MASLYATESDLAIYSISAEQISQFDNAALTPALYAASAFADAYLSSQFELPLTAWDAGLTMHVCHLAAYSLYARRGFNPDAPEDKVVLDRYKEAVRFFRDIALDVLHPQWTDSSPTGKVGEGAYPFVRSNRSKGWMRDSLQAGVDDVDAAADSDPFFGFEP